jgi:hypothetical protein
MKLNSYLEKDIGLQEILTPPLDGGECEPSRPDSLTAMENSRMYRISGSSVSKNKSPARNENLNPVTKP